VDDREHINSLTNDSVDDTVASIEYFSHILALRFRHDAAPIIGKAVSRSARVIMLAMKSAA
jgi:hypothetical protein